MIWIAGIIIFGSVLLLRRYGQDSNGERKNMTEAMMAHLKEL